MQPHMYLVNLDLRLRYKIKQNLSDELFEEIIILQNRDHSKCSNG